jgi:taurine dioxygenase
MVAAYDALSPTLRSMLEGMQAVHDLTPQLRIAVERGISPDQFEPLQQQWPPVVPPPPLRASRRSSSTEIRGAASQGLTNQENALLLPFLLDPVRSPEFECRVHWELDCVRMWDNRCVQHCGVPDFSERRIMHRVTIAGDRPR